MKKFSVVVFILACISMLAGIALVGCSYRQDPDGTIYIQPSSGKPRELPSRRYERVIRNGECWIEFQTPDGMFCIPCDSESGWAQLCTETYRQGDMQPGTAGLGGFGYDFTFIRFASAMLAQDGVAWDGQAILSAYGYDTWQPGDTVGVPMVLESFDTDLNNVSMYIVSRADWEWPDNGSGSNLVGFFFGDPTDNTPDATIFRVRGTFEEVSDSIGAMFIDGVIQQGTFDGYDYQMEIFPIGEGLYQGLFFLDGELVWQRWE